MKSFIKSFSIRALIFLMVFIWLGLSVKAQSVAETSWSRSAQKGFYSETLTFYKSGIVKLFKVFKGRKSTRTGTYLQKDQFLELNFPVTGQELSWIPKYEIINNRLLPKHEV